MSSISNVSSAAQLFQTYQATNRKPLATFDADLDAATGGNAGPDLESAKSATPSVADNEVLDHTGTYSNSNGSSGTFNSSVDHEQGGTSGSLTWTDAQGGQGSHTFANTYAPTGLGTASGTRQSSTTTADGATSSGQGTWTESSPGNFSYAGTRTGPDGKVTDVDKNAKIDRTTTTTGDSKQVDTTITAPDGKTLTSDQTITKDGHGYTQSGTVTGFAGATRTDKKEVSYGKNADGDFTRTTKSSVTVSSGDSSGVTKSSSSVDTLT